MQSAIAPARSCDDPRLLELLALAEQGSDEAVHDLWLEFEYDYYNQASPDAV